MLTHDKTISRNARKLQTQKHTYVGRTTNKIAIKFLIAQELNFNIYNIRQFFDIIVTLLLQDTMHAFWIVVNTVFIICCSFKLSCRNCGVSWYAHRFTLEWIKTLFFYISMIWQSLWSTNIYDVDKWNCFENQKIIL